MGFFPRFSAPPQGKWGRLLFLSPVRWPTTGKMGMPFVFRLLLASGLLAAGTLFYYWPEQQV
jgi:hypothetical protein